MLVLSSVGNRLLIILVLVLVLVLVLRLSLVVIVVATIVIIVVVIVIVVTVVIVVTLVGVVVGNGLLDLLFTFGNRRDDLGGDVIFSFNGSDVNSVGKFVFTESLNFDVVMTILVNLVHSLIEANNVIFLEDNIVLNSQIESDDTGIITNKTLKELSGITLLVITLF